MWNFKDRVQALLACITFSFCTAAVYYPSFYWDPRNPTFQTKAELNVLPSSKLNIICPHFANVLQRQEDRVPWQQMFENLWIVDKASYDTCSVNTSVLTNKKVFDCVAPLSSSFYPIAFQRYSAVKGGLEFQPGRVYYFIATSDGTNSSLSRTSGGHCQSANMKLAIYVCAYSTDSKCSSDEEVFPRFFTAPVRTLGVSFLPSYVTSSNVSTASPAFEHRSSASRTEVSSMSPAISAPASASSSAVQTISPSHIAPAPVSSSAVEPVTPASIVPAAHCPVSLPDSYFSQVVNQSNLLNTILNYTAIIPELWHLLQGVNMDFASETNFANDSKRALTKSSELNCTPCGQPPVLTDCKQLYEAGFRISGVYRVKPRQNDNAFGVYCDQETSGGGWTVLLKRYDASLGFNRGYQQYDDTFGDLTGEFWLGLKRFEQLCYTTVTIRFDLENANEEKRYAEYDGCSIGDRSTKYTITVPPGSYSGDAGDSFTRQSGMKFSSKSNDNDQNPTQNCAQSAHGGWWFKDCEETCLTGYHAHGTYPIQDWGVGILWPTFNTSELIKVSMKIRPTS